MRFAQTPHPHWRPSDRQVCGCSSGFPPQACSSGSGPFVAAGRWIRLHQLQAFAAGKVPAKLPDVSHDPEYEQFIQATGFQFEDDLDEVAFAIHYPTRQQPETRYSEIFIGKLQGQRVRDYLQKIAKSVDSYRRLRFTVSLSKTACSALPSLEWTPWRPAICLIRT